MRGAARHTQALIALSSALFIVHCAVAETTLIEFGRAAKWEYFDKGTEPGPAWRKADYDDSAWPSGPAPLGYGEPGISTTVGFGGDPNAKHTAAYFRHRFRPADAEKIQRLLFLIRSDDGVVVHLNGKEIIRNNLPAGAVGFKTTAARRLDGVDERLYRRFLVPASPLVAGANVVAIEVHQCDPRSSDLFLDLVLKCYRAGEDPRPVLGVHAKAAAEAYHKSHYVGPRLSIPDGYVDGGRGMRIAADGHARSRREVLVVDRSRDRFLRQHLAFARSGELKALGPVDRARRLARYVATEVSPSQGSRWVLQATGQLAREYASQAVLIGEVPRLCGATVCRHRALLFKLLTQEAGLRVALVRGNYKTRRGIGGHAWNELHLADGTTMIVDTMKSPRDAVFAATDSGRAARYLTVRNQPMYKPAAAPAQAKEPSESP